MVRKEHSEATYWTAMKGSADLLTSPWNMGSLFVTDRQVVSQAGGCPRICSDYPEWWLYTKEVKQPKCWDSQANSGWRLEAEAKHNTTGKNLTKDRSEKPRRVQEMEIHSWIRSAFPTALLSHLANNWHFQGYEEFGSSQRSEPNGNVGNFLERHL